MIKFTHKNDFSVVKTGSQSKKILFSILGTKENHNIQRMPLNISLAIDVSGSMNDIVHSKRDNEPPMNIFAPSMPANQMLQNIKAQQYIPQFAPQKNHSTKLHQVIKSAQACLDLLEPGDFISIITFNNVSRVILPSTQITSTNKQMIQNLLNTIWAHGGTNLHDGWVTAGLEVAKNLNANYINRILLLTDGETNIGVQDTPTIVNTVKELFIRGISTTTFGFGDKYNEDLLEKMASISGGNSYYIQDNSEALSTFINEFKCLNSLVTDNATLEFVPTQSSYSITSLNELDFVNKKFIVGNLIHNKDMTYLFEFHFDNSLKNGDLFNLGKMILSYTDSKGHTQNQILDLTYFTVVDEVFANQVVDKDVEVKNAILAMAKTQKMAKEEINRGNSARAYELLNNSIISASAYSFDSNVNAEISQLTTLLAEKDSYSSAGFAKNLSSMAYTTRNNRK